MKNVVGLLLKAAITMVLVACAGQSSDPLKDYGKLKLQPKHELGSDIQTFELNKFDVEIAGSNEKNYGNFIEGKQGELTFKVNSTKVESLGEVKVDIVDFPLAEEPKVVKISNDTFKLVWTPPAGTIAHGSGEINFKVNVTANAQTDEVKTLFLVSKTRFAPKIKGINGLNTVAVEGGKAVEFSVEVEDPNYNGTAPELIITPFMLSNIEAYNADAATFIVPVAQNHSQAQNPQQSGNTFKFFYKMKLDKLPTFLDRKGKEDLTATSVQLCMNFRALSVSGESLSGKVQECIEAKYANPVAKKEEKPKDAQAVQAPAENKS